MRRHAPFLANRTSPRIQGLGSWPLRNEYAVSQPVQHVPSACPAMQREAMDHVHKRRDPPAQGGETRLSSRWPARHGPNTPLVVLTRAAPVPCTLGPTAERVRRNRHANVHAGAALYPFTVGRLPQYPPLDTVRFSVASTVSCTAAVHV